MRGGRGAGAGAEVGDTEEEVEGPLPFVLLLTAYPRRMVELLATAAGGSTSFTQGGTGGGHGGGVERGKGRRKERELGMIGLTDEEQERRLLVSLPATG
jgi:hypothetical protein